MDNGQHIQNSQNLFNGISAGIGGPNGQGPSDENLNQNNFTDEKHDYGSMGGTALNTQIVPDTTIEMSMPPGVSKDAGKLGEVVDLSTPSRKSSEISDNPTPSDDQDEKIIEQNFGDNDVSKGDIEYINNRTHEMLDQNDNPNGFAELIMKIRAKMNESKEKK